MIIPITKIGCVSNNNSILNDLKLSGKEHDLSAQSVDFSEPKEINISIEDKEVTIHIAGERFYSLAYNNSMGTLVGVRFKYLGLGKVYEMQLMDEHEQQVLLD